MQKKEIELHRLFSLEKFDVKFEMVQSVDLLLKSERNENGFGSMGGF